MIKILFVCLGNICRSPMAEFIFKDIISRNGLEQEIFVSSAGTSNEEEGNGMYPLARKKLDEMKISYDGHIARKLKKSDYDDFDMIIGMETSNINSIKRIVGFDFQNKIYRLLDFSDNPKDIDDPWYTGDFDTAYKDISKGCNCLFEYILNMKNKKI